VWCTGRRAASSLVAERSCETSTASPHHNGSTAGGMNTHTDERLQERGCCRPGLVVAPGARRRPGLARHDRHGEGRDRRPAPTQEQISGWRGAVSARARAAREAQPTRMACNGSRLVGHSWRTKREEGCDEERRHMVWDLLPHVHDMWDPTSKPLSKQ
jgi:hypothetical protein